MLRYYMTPETRQAVIAESNRLIAGRAALHAARRQRDGADIEGSSDDGELAAAARAEMAECGSESAFARLVADLASTAASPLRW